MVRVVTILLSLTVIIQTNTGSIFDQFSPPEKQDKNKMLMFLRGLMKLDTPESGNGHINKRGAINEPPKSEYKPVWDNKELPDTNDKSKMLSYLRGLKTPNSDFRVYEEPKHHVSLQTIGNTRDTGINQITQNANARMSQNTQDKQSVVISSQFSDAQAAEQANLDDEASTQVTLLQPAEHERDSDTCFWRGQNSQRKQNSGRRVVDMSQIYGPYYGGYNVPPTTTPVPMSNFEQFGETIINTWTCLQKKFEISYRKLVTKICSIIDTNSTTTTTTTTTTPAPKKG